MRQVDIPPGKNNEYGYRNIHDFFSEIFHFLKNADF